jgi:hypothetical protein
VNTTGNSTTISLNHHSELFGTAEPSTSAIGLLVSLPRPCRCGSAKATIGSSAGFHGAALICTKCNCRRGRLPDRSLAFVAKVTDLFGRPLDPIIIRSPNSGLDPNPVATAVGNLRGNAAPTRKGTEMKISKIYQSKYLNAADLKEEQHRFTIETIEVEEFSEGNKPAIQFKGEYKKFILNKTNANAIAAVLGDDTDGWIGKDATLFPTTASDSHGKSVAAIRVTVPKPSKPAPVAGPTADEF